MTQVSKVSRGTELAINGGLPARATPLPVRKLFGQAEKQAVVDLFDRAMNEGSHLLGYGGEQEKAYCRAFAESLGGGFAEGVNSGSNAVFVALRALEPEPLGEVIVPPVSDPGGIMPVVMCNCVPVPADSEPGYYNAGAEQIAARITERTRAIIVAHIAGIPADMDAIMEVAKEHDLPVIEDCAQAHGSFYQGKPIGSIGDIAAFSTMFGKHHATGGQGGVVFTRNEQLYHSVQRHADRGKPFGVDGSEGNVVASLNCNMDELHAAMGRVQIRRLPEMVAQRRAFVQKLAAGCEQSLKTVRVVTERRGDTASYWFVFFTIDTDHLTCDKDTFVKAVAAEGIDSVAYSYLVVPTRMKWFREKRAFGSSSLPWSQVEPSGVDPMTDLPNVDAVDAKHFRMLIHEDWTAQEADDVVAALAKVEAAYLKSA